MDIRQIQNLAELVRVELSGEDQELLRDSLTEILGYFANLSEVDTSGIPATARIFEGYAEVQDDAVRPGLTRAEVAGMAGDAFDPAAAVFKLQGVFESTER